MVNTCLLHSHTSLPPREEQAAALPGGIVGITIVMSGLCVIVDVEVATTLIVIVEVGVGWHELAHRSLPGMQLTAVAVA